MEFNYSEMKHINGLFRFLGKRPNRLVAYVFLLTFIIILYYLSRSEVLVSIGLGAAIGLFPYFSDEPKR